MNCSDAARSVLWGLRGALPLTSGLCTDRDVACKDYATPSAACGRFGQPLPLCWGGPHGAASGVAEIRDGRHQFSRESGRMEIGATFQKSGPYSGKTGFQSEKVGLLSSKTVPLSSASRKSNGETCSSSLADTGTVRFPLSCKS